MKKLLITTLVLLIASSAMAAQQNISTITTKTSREALRTAVNTELSKVQSNTTELYSLAIAAPWLAQGTAPSITNVFWVDTSGASPVIKYWDGDSWEVAAAGEGGTYTLPAASIETLGGVKQGAGTSIAADGTISVTAAGIGLGTTDNAAFGSVNAAGGTLSAGVANTTQGTLVLYTNTDPIYGFSLAPAALPSATVSLKAPAAMPTADNSLLNFDINGTGGWTDPATLGGGYTNLTSFIAQTAWRLFYSDGSGDVKELALGSDGEYLKSNGAALAPSWATPSGAAHDAVTLDTETSAIFSLSTQQITLDSQTANTFLSAPNGSAGDPTFRAIADADIPSAIARDTELPTDATISTSAVSTNDATTSKHGWLMMATAPASGLRNILAIDNAETSYKNAALFDATSPSTQASGDSAVVGTAMVAARRDHKHAMPTIPNMAAPGAIGGTTPAAATFTTIGAGAAGFAVDADGDVTGKSFAATRTTAAQAVDLYEGTGGGDNKVTIAPSAALSADKTIVAEAILQTTDASANGLSLIGAANYAAMKTLLDTDDIQTLTGITAGTANLGTFTGTTIADSSTIKTGMQALETAVEGKQAAAANLTTWAGVTPGTGVSTALGIAVNTSGGTLTTAAIDDTPADGSLITAPSANWAADHETDTTTHGVTSGAILGGALGSTDNVLLRSDGTGGAIAQGSGITVDDSNNLTTVGTLSGKVAIVVNSDTASRSVTTAEARANTLFLTTNTATTTYTMPTAEAGMVACFKMGQGNSQVLRIDTDGTDYIVKSTGARTSAAGDYYGATASATNRICVAAYDTTDWYVEGETGTWTEE